MKDRQTTIKSNLPEGEKQLDVYLGKYVKKYGGMYIKMGTNYMSGLPDRMVVGIGRIKFIELKSKGNKPTPKQLAVHKQLEKCGEKVYVLTGGEPKIRIQEILFDDEEF